MCKYKLDEAFDRIVEKSEPLKEGLTKSNVKRDDKQGRRLAPPPPPPMPTKFHF